MGANLSPVTGTNGSILVTLVGPHPTDHLDADGHPHAT
jgi:hypothetical protein